MGVDIEETDNKSHVPIWSVEYRDKSKFDFIFIILFFFFVTFYIGIEPDYSKLLLHLSVIAASSGVVSLFLVKSIAIIRRFRKY